MHMSRTLCTLNCTQPSLLQSELSWPCIWDKGNLRWPVDKEWKKERGFGRTCYSKGRNPSQLVPFLLQVMHFLLRVGKDILETRLAVWSSHCNGCNHLHCSSLDREVCRCIYDSWSLLSEGGIRLARFPYPVASIRFSRTKIAPTRRFMQFERRDAREARVCDDPSERILMGIRITVQP